MVRLCLLYEADYYSGPFIEGVKLMLSVKHLIDKQSDAVTISSNTLIQPVSFEAKQQRHYRAVPALLVPHYRQPVLRAFYQDSLFSFPAC